LFLGSFSNTQVLVIPSAVHFWRFNFNTRINKYFSFADMSSYTTRIQKTNAWKE